jgi:hypothetical protein
MNTGRYRYSAAEILAVTIFPFESAFLDAHNGGTEA